MLVTVSISSSSRLCGSLRRSTNNATLVEAIQNPLTICCSDVKSLKNGHSRQGIFSSSASMTRR
jgi:hypothetical protein